MDLTEEDVLQILKILEGQDFEQLHLELGDLKLTVSKSGALSCLPGQPQAAAAAASTGPRMEAPAATVVAKASVAAEKPTPPAAATVEEGLVSVTASMLGIFYSRPGPTEPPYVEVGKVVKADDTVGLIEVMKLFTPVKAGVAGTVIKVCVESGALVEYGQTLFLVKPQAT